MMGVFLFVVMIFLSFFESLFAWYRLSIFGLNTQELIECKGMVCRVLPEAQRLDVAFDVYIQS